MVDDVTLNSGSGGATLAADDIAGVHHQRVKVQYGVDGSATDVSDTNPLPVDDAGGSLTIDNAALSVTGGGTEAGALRVTVANNSTGLISVDDGGASLTIDGTVTADAGTGPWPVTDNAGSLTIDNTNIDNLHSEDFNTDVGTDTTPAIGIAVPSATGAVAITGDVTNGLDVDVTRVSGTVTVDGSGVTQPVSAASLPLPTGAATAANQLPDGHNVTVDNAAGASAVNIQDGGNSITIDGTVTANAGTGPFPVSDNGGSLTVDTTADATDGAAHGASQTGFRAMGTDGTNDQQLSTNASGHVNIADGGNAITVDGTVAATQSGTWTLGANDGVDIGDVTINNAAGGSAVNIQDGGNSITVDNGGTFATQSTLQTGSNLVGDVGLSGARTSGGTTLYKNIDVDETEDEIKGTAGQVYWIHAMNLSASTLYLKFYNATAATVIVGTTTPDLTFPIPTQGDTNGAGFTLSIPNGIAFGTAITIAATTGLADADSGAPGANEVVVNLGYA